MKNFFTLVFGGLAIVAAGIGISYGGAMAYDVVRRWDIPAAVANATSYIAPDGTYISGIKRQIRYTADEEEDLINNATEALPHSSDGAITANAYIVEDLSTGRVVAHSGDDRLLPIASLAKLVAAVVARRSFDGGKHITITESIMDTYGNTGQFHAGEVFRAEDLYYPLLMVSSNDAAEAFAREYGRKQFIQAMNDWAQSIGAYRTTFADPSGLSPEDESTAHDLVLILDWIRRNDPSLLDITTLQTKTVHDHTWVNPTHFLNWSNYRGGKNGFIPESNRTGAALFSLGADHDLYAVVVLGSSARDSDVVALLSRIK